MTVPTKFVSSVEEFRRIFYADRDIAGVCSPDYSTSEPQLSPPSSDSFLLCYENGDAGVSTDGITAFQRQVESSAEQRSTRVRLFIWDSTSDAFAEAKKQLQKRRGFPLLAIVFRGAISDTFLDIPLGALTANEIPRVCAKLALYQRGNAPAHIRGEAPLQGRDEDELGSSPNPNSTVAWTLSVDVVRMMEMGKDLLRKDRAAYAEKIFLKSLKTLEALEGEVCRGEGEERRGASNTTVSTAEESSFPRDYTRSVAHCLAWAAIAQLVQGKEVLHNTFLERLTGGEKNIDGAFFPFTEEPLSDECRACVLWRLMLAAPSPWVAAECSERKLQGWLSANPTDCVRRAHLAITFFLRGEMERALTEAVKLRSLGDAFGRVALKEISHFLGSDHELVARLGKV
ncbi:unnamed protein product [Phytomonas sp. EM1]|nr:unnamed protein product [Phytomonas sp. EM1]|eukprot:CCW61983.1 unnamed protein product [Phytomonas sp. isolate EM1]